MCPVVFLSELQTPKVRMENYVFLGLIKKNMGAYLVTLLFVFGMVNDDFSEFDGLVCSCNVV